MTYEIGYLYQRSADGRDWANGMGPLQRNLRIVSSHDSRAEALTAGARLIGSPSPMGTVADAYLVRVSGSERKVLGAIGADARLDSTYARPAVRSAAALLGRKGGSKTSDAKSAAARSNGRLGGRPKKESAA